MARKLLAGDTLPEAGKRKVADLLGQYSTNVGNALAEAVEEEKNSNDAGKKTSIGEEAGEGTRVGQTEW